MNSCGNLSYEFFYALTTTSTTFERTCFLAWSWCCLYYYGCFIYLCIWSKRYNYYSDFYGFSHGRFNLICTFNDISRRSSTDYSLLDWNSLGTPSRLGKRILVIKKPRHERSLHWDLVIANSLLWKTTANTRYFLRVTRLLGCLAAYSVFIWRYLNVPENWAYVGSIWSIGIMVLTIIPEIIYPFTFIGISMQKKKIL